MKNKTTLTKAIVFLGVSIMTVWTTQSAWALKVSLTARELSWGQRTEKSRDSDGFRVKTTTQNKSVQARVFLYEEPKKACYVQCFFFAKDLNSKEFYLFHKEEQPVTDKTVTLVFEAPKIIKGIKATRVSDVWLVGGGATSGTLIETESSSGSRFYGWVVRVIFDGRVEKVESNQSSLLALAKEAPAAETFEDVADTIKR